MVLCNTILPNFQYLSLIYYCIPFTVFNANVLNPMVFFPASFFCLHMHNQRSCSSKFHDLVTCALKIFILGLVCGSFQFVPQFSVVL
jgi:hypothetical protein